MQHFLITVENNKKTGIYCANQSGKEVYIGGDYAALDLFSLRSAQQTGYLITLSIEQPGEYEGKVKSRHKTT